jgi:hypothetical protein
MFKILVCFCFCQILFAQNIMLKSQFEAAGHTFENLHQNYHLAVQDGIFQTVQSQEKRVFATADMVEYVQNYLKSQDFNFPSKITFVSKYYYDKSGYLDWLVLELMKIPEIMPTNEQLDLFVAHLKNALTHFKLPIQAIKKFYFHTIIDFNQ